MKRYFSCTLPLVLLLFACKKEKHEESKSDEVYISFEINGKPVHFPYAFCSVSWDGLAVSWMMRRSVMPYDAFSVSLRGRMETKEYIIPRDKYSPITLRYIDSADAEYTLEEGKCKLILADSAAYMYKGEFSGRFINENYTDSFDAINGHFFFRKTF